MSARPDSSRRSSARGRRARADVVAGLVNAVVSVPDGLAAAALAGVNPVYGLYTSFSALIAGSALASTQLMQIATTSASALAAGQTIATYPIEQRDDALFLLVILTGLLLAAFGLLGFGRLARFVSHAVMTGFLIGVAAVLILDQLAPLVGGQPEGPNEIVQFVDLLSRPGDFDLATIVIGLSALAIAYGFGRTRIANFSSVLALVLPAALVALIGWESVDLVADVSPIPQGFPGITLPALEPALHAAGEGTHPTTAAILQLDDGQQLIDPALANVGRDGVGVGVEAQVLLGAQVVVERRLLEHQSDRAAHVAPLQEDIEAVDHRRAGRWAQQRAEHVDGRRLAGAVRPEEAEQLALAHLERDARHRLERPEATRQGADLDHVHGCGRWR